MQSHTRTKALLSSDPVKAKPFRALSAPLCCTLPALNAMFSSSLAPWQIKESTLWIQFNWEVTENTEPFSSALSLNWLQLQSLPNPTEHGTRTRAAEQAQAPPQTPGIRTAPLSQEVFWGWRRGEGWKGGREIKKPQQERKMDVQLPGGSADVCAWCTRPGEAVGAAAKDWEVIKACTRLSTIFPVRGVPKVAPMPGCAARCCWLVLLLQLEQQGMQSGALPSGGAAQRAPLTHPSPLPRPPTTPICCHFPLGKWPRYSCAWQTHLFYSGDSLPSMTSISLSFNLD